MGNVIRLPLATRNALVQIYQELIDAGAGAGVIEIRSGSPPPSPDGVATGTLLATLTFATLSAPPAAGGSLIFSPITEDSEADASGEAGWARIKDSDGNKVFDCTVGGPGSGEFLELNTTTITAGGPVRINSFILSVPAS